MTAGKLQWLNWCKDGFLGLLFPNNCWLCGFLIPENAKRLCGRCEEALTTDPHESCPRCGGTVGPYMNLEEGCPTCKKEGYAFDRALRLGPYQGVLRDAILRIKDNRAEPFAEILGRLWAERLAPRLRALKPQVVVPVPLHWTRRYWERGFNQSEIFARCLAKSLQIPCYPHCVRRLRRTPQQSQQASRAARRENVHGAFRARTRYQLAGKTILLVDDVLTTGATVNEVTKALKALRPATIIVAVLAHA